MGQRKDPLAAAGAIFAALRKKSFACAKHAQSLCLTPRWLQRENNAFLASLHRTWQQMKRELFKIYEEVVYHRDRYGEHVEPSSVELGCSTDSCTLIKAQHPEGPHAQDLRRQERHFKLPPFASVPFEKLAYELLLPYSSSAMVWRYLFPSIPQPEPPFLVCTVGSVSIWPGASNVIPGAVNFTVDLRSEADAMRQAMTDYLHSKVSFTCEVDGLSCTVHQVHEAAGVQCSEAETQRLVHAAQTAAQQAPAVRAAQCSDESVAEATCASDASSQADQDPDEMPPAVIRLPSGAGHDAMAMAQVTDIAMLFVRCRGGISHSPEEWVEPADAAHATRVLLHYLSDAVLKGNAV
jgi:Peptidase family M20/M25/M40